MMWFLTKIFVVSILIYSCNVQGYRHQKMRSQYSHEKRLHQLLRALDMSSDEDLSYNRRAAAEGDCIGDVLNEYQWSGQEVLSIPGVDSVQMCIDNCDINSKCVAWTYKLDSKMCWGFQSVSGVINVPGDRSGSCVGTNMKIKCVENKSGQYPGNPIQTLPNIATVNDCMTQCDNTNICFGWLYDTNGQSCYLFRSLGDFAPSDGFLTGSCIAPQQRTRVGDPLKIFRKEVVQRHNDKRKLHCVSDLVSDADLDKAAQDLANTLASADATPPSYDASKMQSVYYGKGDAALHGGFIVDNFYNENKFYNYDKPDFSFTKYFPKIIWKSSTKIGVARAFTADKKSMFVAFIYDSTDSLGDAYSTNIQKPC